MRLRHRLARRLAIAAAVLIAVGGTLAWLLIDRAVHERFEQRLSEEASLLAGTIETFGGEGAELQRRSVAWGEQLDLRVTLIAADGRVVADSRMTGGLELMENHGRRPEVLAAGERGFGSATRQSNTTGETFFYVARRVEGEGPVSVVRLALAGAEIHRLVRRYFAEALLLLALPLLLLSAVAYRGMRLLSYPMQRVAAAADRVARGEHGAPLPREGEGEVYALGRAVAGMRDALLRRIGKLERRQQLFGSVIEQAREGVLLVDGRRRVRLANPMLIESGLCSEQPVHKRVDEAFRHPLLLEMIDAALERGEESRGPLRTLGEPETIFEACVIAVRREGAERPIGALALLHDTTRVEKLEAIRRRFVADLSHELRTPLTSIGGAASTLLEGGVDDEQAARRFLETIRRQSDRMTALVGDLSDLSQIETGAIELQATRFDAGPVIREVLSALAPRYAGLELETSVELPSPLEVEADRLRFEQIMVNLLDNAMKFNRPGGSVRVVGLRGDGRTVIRVHDTGIGIAEKYQERIFQRFYRADESRSKSRRGTGLGLAIVKHLMRLHGGEIRLDSELARGSCFELVFPLPGEVTPVGGGAGPRAPK